MIKIISEAVQQSSNVNYWLLHPARGQDH
jgi:hypothetical protein